VEERYETDLAHSERVLDDVDRALERLSDGSYGSCETCGAPILGPDLATDPTRRVCEQHLAFTHTTEPEAGVPN
jgi:DnaK suppressor protein